MYIQQCLVSASLHSCQIFDGPAYTVSIVSRLACRVVLGMLCQNAMFDHVSIKNQFKNGLKSSRLGYDI